MLMADHWVVTFDCCSRCFWTIQMRYPRIYHTGVTYSMGVFRVQIKKRGEGGRRREREGEGGGSKGRQG